MKFHFTRVLAGLLSINSVLARADIPPSPLVTPKSKVRSVGESVDPGASITPGKAGDPTVRYVTHVVLFEYRMWSSTEGKPLEAKLIAFEDLKAALAKKAGS